MADTQVKDKNMETAFANQDIQQSNTYGGAGGSIYATTSGNYVTSLQFSTNGTWLQQIVVTYDNATSVTIGTAAGNTSMLDLTNDSIARLYVSVISNTAFASGTGVGGIYIETMRGTTYCTLTTSTPLTNPSLWTLVSSGSPAQTCQNIVLTGIAGKSGSAIDAISFYFKNDMLMSQGMSDVVYSGWGPVSAPIPLNIASASVSNQTDQAQTMSINFQESTSSTLNFSAGAGVTLGESVEVDGGVPLVAEGKVTESAEISFTITFGVSATFSKTFSYNASLTVQPGETIQANAMASSYSISGSYTATFAELWAHAGAITRNVNGTVNGVSAYEVNVAYSTTSPA